MKWHFNRRLFLGGAAGLVAVAAGPSFAISVSSAEAFAKKALDELQQIVNSGATGAAREAKAASFFRKYSDVPAIARAVIGAPWRGMSDGQRDEYVKAFESYVVRKYSRMFGSIKGGEVEMLGSKGGGSAGVRVEAQFVYEGYDKPYKIQLHIVDGPKGPTIMDLRILGISLISTERAQVRSFMGPDGNSVDDLILNLKSQ